jgi:hypothetical protein
MRRFRSGPRSEFRLPSASATPGSSSSQRRTTAEGLASGLLPTLRPRSGRLDLRSSVGGGSFLRGLLLGIVGTGLGLVAAFAAVLILVGISGGVL